MLSSKLYWRCFAATEAAVLLTAAVGLLIAGDGAWLWVMLACGTAAAAAAGWFALRPVGRTVDALNQTARSMVSGDARSAMHAILEDAAAAVDQGVQHLQARVTELEHREAALSQDTDLLETVLGTMVEGVIVVDGAERVLYLNGAARSLLDVPRREVIGRPLLEVVRSPGIEAGARAALQSQQIHQSEFEIPRKDKTISLGASPLAGEPQRGAVLVLHDVTELRRLERMRRDFVSNVSHELKTPLTAIQAYADTLSDGAVDDPEHNRRFLARIIEQAQRLETLILDLLRLARIESQQTVELSPISLGAAVADCVRDLEPIADAKQLALETAGSEPCHVLAESGDLRQLIENLLDNAIKYTPPQGRVSVQVRRDGQWGILEVSDTGIGIAREDQQRIFERFYRVDRARARAVGGTGLGLSIVKHVVQQFGGEIAIASELGKGTQFTVRLPLANHNP